jgi:hypothetical protein
VTEIAKLRQRMELLEKRVGLLLDTEAEVARQFTERREGFDDWLAANRASRKAIEDLDAARCEYLLSATKVCG